MGKDQKLKQTATNTLNVATTRRGIIFKMQVSLVALEFPTEVIGNVNIYG